MTTVSIVGILDDGWAGLSDAARRRLREADVVIGAARTLALVAPLLKEGCETRVMDGALSAVPQWIEAARRAACSVAVLASGDPLCHGIAAFLLGRLGGESIEILPAPSTLQLACARWQKPWHDVVIASCHGRDAGEWFFGATPEHGLYAVMQAVAVHPRVFVFLSPQNDPTRLARALLTAGFAEARLSLAARLMRHDEAIQLDLPVAEAAAMRFAEPCVALVEREIAPTPRFGLEDGEYLQRAPEKGLITKQEARCLSLAKLRIAPAAIVWDIGAGSGSVGIEAARLAPQGHVWAIEKNPQDAAIARANAARYRLVNYTLIEDRAPAGLDAWPDPDAVFIGGSGGELPELIRLALARLKPGGRLVMNFVTLENLHAAMDVLQASGADWEIVQLQGSRSQPILAMHRLAAQNPVWIVTVSKERT